MLAQWTGEVKGILHTHQINDKQLAERIGWNKKYLSAVLNCKRNPKGAEQKVKTALNEIINNSV